MPDPSALRVVVAAAHPLVRGGLRALLEGRGDVEVVGQAAGSAELARVAGLYHADAALLDWTSAEARQSAGATQGTVHTLPVVALGDPTPPYVVLALQAGARGYLPRDAPPDEVAAAVKTVAEGLVVLHPLASQALLAGRGASELVAGTLTPLDEPLTARELEILQELASGLPNKAIAARLGISEHTVKFHVGAILAKLDAASRTEAVTIAARRGLLVL